MVAIGALAAATQLVGIDALMAAAYEVLPSYRATHAQANAEALRTGMTLFSEPLANAWAAERAVVPR
jgi:Pyruvate/2-oxoacid:ferredoxin oxidoreductase gamma subunit